MKVSEILEQTWAAVFAEAPPDAGHYHRRIPISCAWPVHAGLHRPTNAHILIFEVDRNCLRDVQLKEETKGFLVEVVPDDAGRHERAMVFVQEKNVGYQEIFKIFSSDVIEHWISHTDSSNAVRALARRLALWRRFFQRGIQTGLSREQYIGLYGELSFLEAGLAFGLDSEDLVDAWQAPLGTNQDYLFGASAVEIKTTTGNAIDQVKITNVRQLDETGLSNLFLVHFGFDFRQGAGRTLSMLVNELRPLLLSRSAEAVAAFDDRLLASGFVQASQGEFEHWGFTPRRFRIFQVRGEFPRILEEKLPKGVSDVSYSVNLASANEYEVSETYLWESINSTNG